MLILVEGTGKNQMDPGQESMGMLQCCRIALCYDILEQNLTVCSSIVVKEKSTFGSRGVSS
jgi:hypothetical protein